MFSFDYTAAATRDDRKSGTRAEACCLSVGGALGAPGGGWTNSTDINLTHRRTATHWALARRGAKALAGSVLEVELATATGECAREKQTGRTEREIRSNGKATRSKRSSQGMEPSACVTTRNLRGNPRVSWWATCARHTNYAISRSRIFCGHPQGAVHRHFTVIGAFLRQKDGPIAGQRNATPVGAKKER